MGWKFGNILAAASFVWLMSGWPVPVQAQELAPPVVVYFFWGEGCPHCGQEKPFLAALKDKYPTLVVRDYEVWHHQEGKNLYQKMALAYGLARGGVPATFVGRKYWVGYDPDKAAEIDSAVQQCLREGCPDPADVSGQAVMSILGWVPPMTLAGGPQAGSAVSPVSQLVSAQTSFVHLPFAGSVDTSKWSLPVLTFVLAGLDGFNPCAFFVLLSLLSLMVHAQSRLRMLSVGGIFVFFSGLVYFLFMAAWLNVFMLMGRVGFVTVGAGLVAVGMAVVNIKDYFFFKQGISLTLSESAQSSLFSRMRGLVRGGSWGGLVVGSMVLAALANLYELLCTAGFPMVFTRALTLQKLPVLQYYLYLIAYNVIYVLPLLVIVVVFSATLGARKLTEAEGRVLKLVSGLMMLGLGALLLLRPELLSNIFVSLGLMAGVLLAAALIVWCRKERATTPPAPKDRTGF